MHCSALVCHFLLSGLLVAHALRKETPPHKGGMLDEIPHEDRRAMAELEAAYGATNFWDVQAALCGKCVSTEDQESIMRANRERSWSAGIYGEVKPYAAVTMLKKLGAKFGMRYYDLGSGAGKTVAIAAHFFGMNATGVELSKDRHDAGCLALKELQRVWSRRSSQARGNGTAELVHASFFEKDFSDAELVFMDSVEFTTDMMQRLAAMGKSLKQGTRIASWRELPGEEFREVDHITLEATWGNFSIRVYEKTAEERPALSLPEPASTPESCHATHVSRK